MQNNLKKLLLLPSILFAQICLFTNGINGGLAQPNNEVYSQKITQETSTAELKHTVHAVSYVHILSTLLAISISVLLLQSVRSNTAYRNLYKINRYLLQHHISEFIRKQNLVFLNINTSTLCHDAFYSVHHCSSSRIKQ